MVLLFRAKMPVFYHYTSSKGAQAILNNPVIRPSQERGGFPAGVHFTTLGKQEKNYMSEASRAALMFNAF